jgi:DNA ligase-1
MRRFAELYRELDESNATNDKVAALVRYFREAPSEDAAWSLTFLTGNHPPRSVPSKLLRQWAAEFSGTPDWLLEECYEAVGDLAETLAQLIPHPAESDSPTLSLLVVEHLLPLREMDDDKKRRAIESWWRRLGPRECYLWHKLLLGGWRVGVSRTLVARALAEVAGTTQAEMSHRLMGNWECTAAGFQVLLAREQGPDLTKPYPFFLAHPLQDSLASLGEWSDWQAEWKWDGIRAQLIRRGGEVLIWSRGEELVTDRYPEVALAAKSIPDGTVLDGEMLAWKDEQPLPFQVLQARIGRKSVTRKILQDSPVCFMAYDILEINQADIRGWPLSRRRDALSAMITSQESRQLRLSPALHFERWEDLPVLRDSAREKLVEGIMLKRISSPYRTGRVTGDWWKWKLAPFTMDAVLVYAQAGHGKRASLYTDYTFAVWKDDQLVPVAKAYSGLTDVEIREVDRWIRAHTLDKHGPVRVVEPALVFEIAFEGIQVSTRHKAGLALRFPRILRWRKDKQAADADRLEALHRLRTQ